MSAAEMREDKIDLAGEPDFRLGLHLIRPSICQVISNDGEEHIEPRVMEVLVTLYRAQGQIVTRDQLVDACWGGRIVSDDAVTRAIAKVRRLTRGTEPPPFTLETIPRIGFRLVAALDPLAAPCSPDPAPATGPLQRRHHRPPLIVGAVAAVCCAVALVYWVFASSPAAQATSVAVFPFAAPQSDTELVQLAGRTRFGIARILAASGLPTVLSEGVAPTLAQPQFRVEGRADKQGDKYLMSGAISDSASGRVLWSTTSERNIEDVAGIDEALGRTLSRVLGCALRERGSSKLAASLEVFSLVLNACDAIGKQASDAVDVTRRLVAAAPTLAGAHALHAYALAEHARGLDQLSEEAALLTKQMRDAASRAIELNPNTAFAHVALGIRIGSDERFTERERNLRRALEIDPSHGNARLEYSMFLREVGRLGAALEVLTPLDGARGAYVNRAFLFAMSGDLRSANQELDSLKVVQPEWERDVRWVVSVWWDDPAVVLPKLQSLAEKTSRQKNYGCFERLLTALARPGNRPVMRGLAPDCDGMSLDWQVRMLARQGDIDGAYESMGKAFPKNRQLRLFLFYPELKAFRQDQRFMPLADRLGLLRYWRETNQWPDFCAETDLPYDCRAKGSEEATGQLNAQENSRMTANGDFETQRLVETDGPN